MQLEFVQREEDETSTISLDELTTRLATRFPGMRVDRARGDRHVQEGLNRLQNLGVPEVILESHRCYFGNVAHISIADSEWGRAEVHGYLQTLWPLLGDRVQLCVDNVASDETLNQIVRDLEAALELEFVARG